MKLKRYFVRSENTVSLLLFSDSFPRGNHFFLIISDFSFPGGYQFINFYVRLADFLDLYTLESVCWLSAL